MTKTRIWLLGLTIAILALAAGIYTGLQQSNSNSHAVPLLSKESIDRLFASALNDPNGKTQAFAQWQGKMLVLNFWASWCPPCREEMPAFSRLQTKYAAKDVQFVGIALDTAEMVREFSALHPVNYPLLIGGAEGAELARQLGNTRLALPYTLIISPTGETRFIQLGGISEHELDLLLQQNTLH